MIWVLCALTVTLTGIAAYLFVQTQTLFAEQNQLAMRVTEIESKLSVTDESLSQSGAAIQSVLQEHSGELDTHMSEIRKLWAVSYDRNRPAIAKLEQEQRNSGSRIDALSGNIAKIDSVVQGYDGIRSRMETMSSQLLVQSATLDDVAAQARELSDRAAALDSDFRRQNSSLATHEEAIEAIDQYRILTNQRLRSLEQQLGAAPPGG